MQNLHVATIEFLKPLLEAKQLQMARAARMDDFTNLAEEFENLQNRLYTKHT
jgi:hypothetical protein